MRGVLFHFPRKDDVNMTEEQRMIDAGARSFMALTVDMTDAIREHRFNESNYERRMERFREYNLKLALSDDDRLVTIAAVNNNIIAALREMAEGGPWQRYNAEKRLYALATSWGRLMREVMA